MNVAFIGLGLMGAGMAANLLKAGHAVRVHTRTKEKAQALLTLGATWANTPRAAAKGATVAITMLAHPAAVEAIAMGDAGLLAGLAPGTLWIDSTTVSPRFSRLMFDESSQRAVRFIDAPVLGSKQPAREARLVFLVGGDKVDVASVEPLLLSMGREVRHLGPIGSGSALKLVFNHLLGTSMATFAEALCFGEVMGLERTQLLDVLIGSAVTPPFLSAKKAKLAEGNVDVEFRLQWMLKDLGLVCESAQLGEQHVPIAAVAQRSFEEAMSRGHGEDDFSAIALPPISGRHVR